MEGEFREQSLSADMPRTTDEARALRTALLVIGAVMVIPGLVAFAFGLVNLYEFVDNSTLWRDLDQLERHSSFIISLQVIAVVSSLGAVVMGLLLVLLSWNPAILSVRALLYPALVIGGIYLVFTWLMDLALSAAYVVYLDWPMGLAQLVILPAYRLPALVGGIVLILVGMRRSQKPRQGTQVVRSYPGSGL